MRVLRGVVIDGGRRLTDGVVRIVGDRITAVGPADTGDPSLPPPSANLLLPGLVDVHCHGGAGEGFPDADPAGVRRAAAHHLDAGTTTLLASLVSAPAPTLATRIGVLAPLVADGVVAGIHLEGPFLSTARCGAQDPRAIVPGDPVLLEALLKGAAGAVRSMTLAPETANVVAVLEVLGRHAVLPSFGHTDADARTTTAAIHSATARPHRPVGATHLFNGMAPLHHRAPGPVAACLAAAARGEMVVELIADGVHLAPETVATVFDLVGPTQIALVTDAMAASGMPDGRFVLGSMDVTVTDGVARLSGAPEALAGGTARLLDVVRSTALAGVRLEDAVLAATATPARLVGLHDQVGSLAAGRRADVLVTDPDLRPVEVLRGGVTVADHREEVSSWRS